MSAPSIATPPARAVSPVPRLLLLLALVLAAFLICSAQVVRLATTARPAEIIAVSEPIARNWARPAIVDRNGVLLASDVATPSLYADPKLVIDRDEVVEKLRGLLPDLDERELLRQLGEEGRRFVWIKRGLTPQLAQRIHDLGLPGLAFRKELRRVHPAGAIAPYLIGQVDIDNRGLSGIERTIDGSDLAQPVLTAVVSTREPVRLTLDVAVQHAVRQELQAAIARYKAKGATAVVLDARTGALTAAVSLPDTSSNKGEVGWEGERIDRLSGGIYELGSIFKAFTVAMALDSGAARLDTSFDARVPLVISGRKIDDFHGQKRQLTTGEIFLHSSNIGAGLMALKTGAPSQRQYLERFGLTGELIVEGLPVASPLLPPRWTELETATIAYGHGLALTPLQFAAAAAALVNGGTRVWPSILAAGRPLPAQSVKVIRPEVSQQIRDLMRLNVVDNRGTGRRADVPGLEIGGKTGTADIARNGRYEERAVIASFLAAFPIGEPRYVTLLTLFEPQPTIETKAQITAGVNAAPASGRMIARIAPLLGLRSIQQASVALNR